MVATWSRGRARPTSTASRSTVGRVSGIAKERCACRMKKTLNWGPIPKVRMAKGNPSGEGWGRASAE